MRKVVVLLALLISVSCSTSHKSADLDQLFSGTEQRISHTLCLSEEFLWGTPARIHYADSTLIARDDSGDGLFVLIDTKRKQVIGTYGSRGQGVNEFLQPSSFQTINDTVVGVYDVWKRALVELNLRNMIRGVVDYPVVLKSSLMSTSVVPTAFDTFVGLGIYEDCMLKLMDKNGKVIASFFEYPYKDDTEKEIKGRARAMAYQGTFHSNPAKDKAVYAVNGAPMVYFYKMEQENITEMNRFVFGYPSYKPELTEHSTSALMSKDDKKGFIDSYVTNKYVYLAYSGKSYGECQLKAFSASVIYVFDWNGIPVRKYNLDVDITSFCVSDNDRELYGFSNIPEPTLVCFGLENE